MEGKFCNICGSKLNRDGSCPNCDKYRLKKQASMICKHCGNENYYDDFSIKNNKKVYIVKCNNCGKVIKGNNLVILRNISIVGFTLIIIYSGLKTINLKKEVKEVKGESTVSFITDSKKEKDKIDEREEKLKMAIVRFQKDFENRFNGGEGEYIVGNEDKNGDIKKEMEREIEALKAEGITKLYYLTTSYIIDNEYDESTKKGRAIIGLNDNAYLGNNGDKKNYSRKIELNYEFDEKEILLTYISYKTI